MEGAQFGNEGVVVDLAWKTAFDVRVTRARFAELMTHAAETGNDALGQLCVDYGVKPLDDVIDEFMYCGHKPNFKTNV